MTMGNIKVGSRVKIVDKGELYSTYKSWFKQFATEFVIKYAEYKSVPNGSNGIVVAKHTHESNSEMLYAVDVDNKVYLIGEDGIVLVPNKSEKEGKAMGNKFKVGDKVVCVESNPYVEVGTIGIVEEDDDVPNVRWEKSKSTRSNRWTLRQERMELVAIHPSITIYPNSSNRNETIAVLKEGDKVVKKATANYNPSDAKIGLPYDFNVGADWAVKRLLGKTEVELIASATSIANPRGAYTEVKKTPNVGEYIKTTRPSMINVFEKDEIHKVTQVNSGIAYIDGKNSTEKYEGSSVLGKIYVPIGSFVVLNGYQPTTYKEVKRQAKVGEYVKVVNATNDMSNEYKNGDILKIIKVDRWAYYKDEIATFLFDNEYVVLENYNPTDPVAVEKPISFKKAKVGDTIKIVKGGIVHIPNAKVGQTFKITEVDKEMVYTGRNFFRDKNEEYIIVEPKFDISTVSKVDLLAELSRRIGE